MGTSKLAQENIEITTAKFILECVVLGCNRHIYVIVVIPKNTRNHYTLYDLY